MTFTNVKQEIYKLKDGEVGSVSRTKALSIFSVYTKEEKICRIHASADASISNKIPILLSNREQCYSKKNFFFVICKLFSVFAANL